MTRDDIVEGRVVEGSAVGGRTADGRAEEGRAAGGHTARSGGRGDSRTGHLRSLTAARDPGLLWLVVLVLTVAWGVLAFGAVYPWAYRPLLFATAACGLWGFLQGRNAIAWRVAGGLLAVALAIFVQLQPLPWSWVRALSPAAHARLMDYDLAYSHGVATGGEVYHALSMNPDVTDTVLAFLVSLGLLMLGTARALSRTALRRLVASVMLLGAAVALIGVVQQATSTHQIYGWWTPLQGRYPFGPFVNPNHFAGWMLMVLPLTMGYLVGLTGRAGQPGTSLRERIIWLSTPEGSTLILGSFAVIAMGTSLVLTRSRSGLGAFAVALLVTMAMIVRRQASSVRRAVRLAYVVALVAIIVGWVGVDGVAARFARPDTPSIGGRLAIWSDTLPMLRDFPVAGTGLGTFATVNLFYQRALPDKYVSAAHNDWLQVAAEGGLLVTLPVLGLLAMLVWETRRRFAEHAARQDLGLTYWTRFGAVTGLLAIGVQEIVEFSLQMPGNAALFAVLCAIAVAPMPADGPRRRPARPAGDGSSQRSAAGGSSQYRVER